mmetsp:Transcript_11407/g.18925  ORF Transcript_11407/g.18925 Transcript_11407/m.18925 type:complete len:283 (-) Transcript_11407:70-918(-)
MRHGRAKAARKTLQFFRLSIGIAAPYQVLLDGTFLVAMLAQKVPLRDRLDRTLQHQAYTLLVTRSSLDELETLAQQQSSSNDDDDDNEKKQLFAQARQWGFDYCDSILEEEPKKSSDNKKTKKNNDSQNSDDNPLGAAGSEMLHLVRSKPHYFVASQDETLLDVLRFTGTTPLIRLSRGVLLLENPSKAQQSRAKSKEKSKWFGSGVATGEQERQLVQHAKQTQRREQQEQQQGNDQSTQQKRHGKKAKGPNPLSCKKKRSSAGGGGADGQDKEKRKRRRKK